MPNITWEICREERFEASFPKSQRRTPTLGPPFYSTLIQACRGIPDFVRLLELKDPRPINPLGCDINTGFSCVTACSPVKQKTLSSFPWEKHSNTKEFKGIKITYNMNKLESL